MTERAVEEDVTTAGEAVVFWVWMGTVVVGLGAMFLVVIAGR